MLLPPSVGVIYSPSRCCAVGGEIKRGEKVCFRTYNVMQYPHENRAPPQLSRANVPFESSVRYKRCGLCTKMGGYRTWHGHQGLQAEALEATAEQAQEGDSVIEPVPQNALDAEQRQVPEGCHEGRAPREALEPHQQERPQACTQQVQHPALKVSCVVTL